MKSIQTILTSCRRGLGPCESFQTYISWKIIIPQMYLFLYLSPPCSKFYAAEPFVSVKWTYNHLKVIESAPY